MATVYPKIEARLAHMPEVRAAVLLERDKLAAAAKALFAAHDNPGGHEINTDDPDIGFSKVDGFVNLEGPAPLAVEFGHWTPHHAQFVDGLHILGRTVASARA